MRRPNNTGIAPIAAGLFLAWSLVPLSAAEPAPGEIPGGEVSPLTAQFYSEYVRAFLNNEYLLENIRLLALAEERRAEGLYDDAFEYATEAIRYADLSDGYVGLHLRIRETDGAISSARFRLEWAGRIGAPESHAETYGRAETSFAGALAAHSREEWDQAKTLALQVIDILSELPDVPILPARFLVRTWAGTRDCLWNIAALPEVFGDPTRWPLLYQANRDRMPRPGNPHLIRPGMILDIPSIAGEIRHGLMEE